MPERQSRPGANQAASDVIPYSDHHIVATTGDAQRCTRCGHPIWAAASVRRGLGPACRRAVA